MISFSKKMHNWGVIHATTEEWAAIKSLIEHVTNPEVFNECELDVMSGLDHLAWQQWIEKFRFYGEPPTIIARSELIVIFATANNAEDAKVQGLTGGHMATIDALLECNISDAVEC